MWDAKSYVYMLIGNNMLRELLSIDAFNRVALKNDSEWNVFSEEYSLHLITSEHIAENIKKYLKKNAPFLVFAVFISFILFQICSLRPIRF